MKVIKPITLTSAMLVSSTAPETDYAAWNAATAYAIGDYCIRTSTHRVYRRLIAGTTATAPESDGVNWIDYSPTNTWAMFDSTVSTQTAIASPLTVVIKPGICNSLALFGLEGTTLDTTVRDGLAGPVVYTKSVTLDGTTITDWYQYFFEPPVQLQEVVMTDLPPYSNAHITITVTGGSTCKVGALCVGTWYDLGLVQYGCSVGIQDWSIKSTDAFGTTSFIERAYSKTMSVRPVINKGDFNRVSQLLTSLRAKPSVWVGTDAAGYEPLTIFGFPKSFSIDVAYSTTVLCSLEIEGLT